MIAALRKELVQAKQELAAAKERIAELEKTEPAPAAEVAGAADAIQIHKTRLDKQFEQRVNAEVRRRIDVADDAVRASYSKLSKENLNLHLNLQRIITQGAVFTKTQFRQLQMVCHPDNSASTELRAEMLRLINDHQRRLVKPEDRLRRKPTRSKRGN